MILSTWRTLVKFQALLQTLSITCQDEELVGLVKSFFISFFSDTIFASQRRRSIAFYETVDYQKNFLQLVSFFPISFGSFDCVRKMSTGCCMLHLPRRSNTWMRWMSLLNEEDSLMKHEIMQLKWIHITSFLKMVRLWRKYTCYANT